MGSWTDGNEDCLSQTLKVTWGGVGLSTEKRDSIKQPSWGWGGGLMDCEKGLRNIHTLTHKPYLGGVRSCTEEMDCHTQPYGDRVD